MEQKTDMGPNELQNHISMRDFLQKKYTKDILLTAMFLAVVITMRAFCFISNDVTGTLLGAIAGYAMGGLRKLHE